MIRPIRLAAAAVATSALALPAMAQDVTVETARGEATVPAAPETVVVFNLAALDTLGELGVDVDGTPDLLGNPDLEAAAGDAEVVGTVFEPDFEAVNAMGPDLAVVGGRSASQFDALSRIAPTIDMTIPGENLIETGLANVDAFGTIFEREDAAAELRTRIEDRMDEARSAIEGAGTGLIVLTNGPSISAYGAGSRFGWIHDSLGLEQSTEVQTDGRHGEPVSFEYIAEANPDWLLVIDRAAAIGNEGERARATLDNPLVAETTAWQEDQVVYLDPADAYLSGGGAGSILRTLDTLTEAFGQSSSES